MNTPAMPDTRTPRTRGKGEHDSPAPSTPSQFSPLHPLMRLRVDHTGKPWASFPPRPFQTEQKEEKLFIFSIKETLDSNPTFVPELLGQTKRLSGFPENVSGRNTNEVSCQPSIRPASFPAFIFSSSNGWAFPLHLPCVFHKNFVKDWSINVWTQQWNTALLPKSSPSLSSWR